MSGLSVDDEFYDEYNIFLKHRPTFQYYFKSPLGMQDMLNDYPASLRAEEARYDEFVLGNHWSSNLDWLAILLGLTTILYIGYVFTTYLKTKLVIRNKRILYYLGFLPLVLGSVGFYYLGAHYYWFSLLFLVLGTLMVALSNKNIWVKILTILLVPVLSVVLFFLFIFSFTDLS